MGYCNLMDEIGNTGPKYINSDSLSLGISNLKRNTFLICSADQTQCRNCTIGMAVPLGLCLVMLIEYFASTVLTTITIFTVILLSKITYQYTSVLTPGAFNRCLQSLTNWNNDKDNLYTQNKKEVTSLKLS